MKAAVYFAEGYEELEALSVVDILRRGNIEVKMVGVTGKHVKSARAISIEMDVLIEDLNHDEIDMLILPGGIPGVYNLEKSELVLKNITDFKNQGKWLAAICAAPSILGKLGLLAGEKATCYPGNEKYLSECEYVDQETVISHKMITSKGVGTAIKFALLLLETLKDKETSDQVKEAILFQQG